MGDRQIVAFDVDGTLIDREDRRRMPVCDLLVCMYRLGFEVWVWSGGGKEYAERWVQRIGISDYVHQVLAKDRALKPHVAIDDAVGADLGLLATLIIPECVEEESK